MKDTRAQVRQIVARLVNARHRAGLTQVGLARAMDTAQSTISEVESGRKKVPLLSTVLAYADAVGLDLMPDPAVTRQQVHERIVAEMVCCDLYERINSADHSWLGLTEAEWAATGPVQAAILLGLDFHAICFWGGYAASIALNECPSGRRSCEPLYYCPATNRIESPCHGGFDKCCDREHLHRPV